MRLGGCVAKRLVSRTVGVTLLALLFIPVLMASGVVTLTFEGLQNNEQILNFYNGGTGGSGSGPGTNYGISFGSSALAVIEQKLGGSGNMEFEPTPGTAAFFLTGPGVIMNVPTGFTTGFSFYYAAASYAGSVTVYDGVDGTGSVLATLTLPVNGGYCKGSAYTYSCWSPMGVSFSGTAKSVNFSGVANYVAFDNITMGSATPGGSTTATVPALSEWGLILLGILLLGVAARVFRSASARI